MKFSTITSIALTATSSVTAFAPIASTASRSTATRVYESVVKDTAAVVEKTSTASEIPEKLIAMSAAIEVDSKEVKATTGQLQEGGLTKQALEPYVTHLDHSK